MKKVLFALTLFNFIFLGAEYLFDNMMMYVTGAEKVVLAQSYILGISVLGFILFPLCSRYIKKKYDYIVLFLGTITAIICIFLIQQHTSYVSVLTAGGILFLLLGITGSSVHYLAARIVGRCKGLAKVVGNAYALGIFLQYINNNLITNDTIEAIVMSIALAVLAILLLRWENTSAILEEKERYIVKNRTIAGVMLVAIVALMTCIFASLDNAVTLVHATGSEDIGQWPRLLLGLSGIAGGVLFDWRERRYMGMMMYCITLLSTACVVTIETGGEFMIGLIVFYLSAGFFVVYFTASFMELSMSMKVPELWAGLGRAVNNLSAVTTGGVSISLLTSQNSRVVMIVALVLFALLSIANYFYAAQFVPVSESVGSDVLQEAEDETNVKKFNAFSKEFLLTEREKEILKILLSSDEGIQNIADQLYISRAALYRHMTSLNEKTGTKSRIGILQLYYTWKYDMNK